MNISVSPQLKELWPAAALGVLHYQAEVTLSPPQLLQEFERTVSDLARKYSLDTIADNPHIAATRKAYKALGKHPLEYRNAAEAMLRRVVKSSGLYHINNIVEVNNLISISSGYTIGSYDSAGLKGDVLLQRAEEGAHYDGIGKSSVNIGCLPVLYDEEGPFGNPTSDSRRAMIQPGPREIYSILYSFDGPEGLHPWLEQYKETLQKYCGVGEVEINLY